MKSKPFFLSRASQKIGGLMLALLGAGVLVTQAAIGPTVTNTLNTISINDNQTSSPYANSGVEAGATNVLTVYVDYAPTNFGALNVPSGVVFTGTNYVITATNGLIATTIIGNFVFTPAANRIPVPNTSNVVFHIFVSDAAGNTSATRTTTLQITSVNDAPVLTASGTTNITDKQTAFPFNNVSVTDVDNQGTQAQTVTVTLAGNGYLNTANSTFTSNNLAYTFTGAPSQIATNIQRLEFVPTANFLPVGQTDTNVFTILVSDDIVSRTNSSVRVLVYSTNDVPALTGVSTNHAPVETGQTASPFVTLTFVDPDRNDDTNNTGGQSLVWQVALSGVAPLGTLAYLGNPVGTTFGTSNGAAASTIDIRNLTYNAPLTQVAGTNVVTMTITANDGHGGVLTTNMFIDLYSVVLPPGLSGLQSGQTVNDNTTVAPFSKVKIQTFNGGAVTVRITLTGGATNDVRGQLINLGSFTRTTFTNAPSLYQFTGTSEAATAAVQALLFQPTPNRIDGSSSETVTFGLTLVDGVVTNAQNNTTTVIVLPVNDTPTIAGLSPLTTIQDNETIPAFSTVLIGDVDESGQQPISVTISLDVAAKGSFNLTNVAGVTGFTNSGGAYVSFGTASNLSAAIRKLVFVPTPNRVPVGLTENATFTVLLNDQHGGILANNSTVIRVASVTGVPVINVPTPQPVSIPVATNIFPFQSVTISDSTTLKVAVRINNTAQGSFTTNSLASAGFTNVGSGVYLKSGAASNITAAIQLLDFSPSPSLPAGATINFTISATNTLPNFVTVTHSIILRTVKNSFIVTKLTDYDPAGSVSATQKEGTLRKAIADAKSGDHITFDIRSGVVGQPDYPAVIRLLAPIVLDDSLVFDGPGAERLTISGDTDANGTADVQLFTINNEVTMNRLTFASGHGSFAGGAFEVSEFGSLKLSYCTVSDSVADVWGGAVDVDGGQFSADHCLFRNNSTSASLGLGGGALSLYTYQVCTIVNSTFATNRQNSIGGLGGGAVYAETFDSGVEFDAYFLNCTFRDNVDMSGHGSSIRPNVFNTYVQLQNSIVADGRGKNIEMDQSGAVVSLGGNISDDATATIFSIGGDVTNTFVFHPPQDKINVNITNILTALTNNGGPTFTFPLPANSVALNSSISNAVGATFYTTLGTDQRGYFRDGNPDIGAFERGADKRIIIEELCFNPAPPNTNDQFIELYVPRDSAALDVAGFQVLVDGVLRHTFTAQSLQPGEALVLFSAGAVSTGVPTGVFAQVSTNALQLNRTGGLVTVLNANGQVVYEADYVANFTSTDPSDPGYLSANYQSLVLSPQFQGVFLPYQRVVAKEGSGTTTSLSNPGYDANGNPLAVGNAPPVAFADVNATDAHTIIPAIAILANDLDPDITDTIRVVGVGTNGNPAVTGATNYSLLGARLIINDSPAAGASVSYDPTASAYITALPQGSNVVDTFQYTILDYLGTNANSRGSSGAIVTQNLAKATATVTLSIVGVNSAPTPQADSSVTKTNLATLEDVVLDFTTATNLLWNDTDPNTDDNSSTLAIVSLCETNGYVSNQVAIVTALGATATLDIRFDRNETHITYDPRGSATLNALGYNHVTNDVFYYSVKDRYGAIGTASVAIKVTGVNDRPTANADTLATDEDTVITTPVVGLLANDTDPDNATTLSISAVTPLSAYGASVQLNGTNLVYNPTVSTNLNALAQKEFAIDTFTCTVTDENGLSSNAVVTVTVAGLNDRPISQPDFYTNIEDTLFAQVAPGVLANDVEPDINGLTPDDSFRVIPFTMNTVTNAYTATNGGAPLTMTANGSFTLDPRVAFDWVKEGEVATNAFKYVVMDHSLSIAANDNFAVTATTTNNVLPVLANDFVLSQVGGAFTLTGVTTPNHGGTAVLNASNNAIIYTPLAGYVGTETFSYSVADGLGGTDTAVVTVTLTASTLYALPDAYTVAKGTTNVLNLMVNDGLIPATGASITIASLGAPSLGGTVAVNGTGPNNTIVYAPNPTQPTPFVETLNYVIASGTLTATGTVSVTVIDRGNSLTANNDIFTVAAGSGNTSFNVLANDLILPGPNTNYIITGFVSNGVLGSVSLNAAQNRLVYKPSNTVSNHQEPSVSYTISDGVGGTATASVAFRVVPSGFIANDDNFVVVKNSTNTLPVMVNDVKLPNLGETLFISGIGIASNAPSHGTVTIDGPGTGLIYTPNANFNGSDDFTYEIAYGNDDRALGHVHVTVLDVSAAPSNPDTYRVARESADNALLVLANDYTLPKTIGAYTITALQTNGVHATVIRNGTGTNNSLLYTPNAGFIGRDAFSYVFIDTLGNQGTNNVTVTVGDLAPRADEFNVVSDTSANVLDVRANDYSFPDTNALRVIYSFGTPDQGGTVTTNAGATAAVYTPAPGFVGVEHFAYNLKDDSTNLFTAVATINVRRAGSDRDTNTATLIVVGVNDLPTITGAQSGFHITDKMTIQPFTNVVIGDRDEFGYQTNVLTVSLDNAVKGTLTNLGGFVNVGPGVYRMQDSPPAITASLKTLVFVPTENRIIVPTSETTTFTIVANDGYVVSPITNNVTTVIVDSVNDAPVIAGTQGGFAINDKQTVQPFTAASITEVDDSEIQSLVVRVSLDTAAKGVLQNLGSFTNAGNGVYSMTGVASNITTSLKLLRFVPTENRITVPTSEVTTLTISVNDGFTTNPVIDSLTTITVTATNDAPTLVGVLGGHQINDKQTVAPFTNVVIADVDDLTIQPLRVTVAFDVSAKGTLLNLGGFTNAAPGVYSMLSTASNITSSIRNLVFKPTENRITVPTSETTTLTIFVDDGFQSPMVTNQFTTIIVTATNDAPTIVGTQTNNITDKQTVLPFANVTFADVDNLVAIPPNPQTLTVRLVMDNLDKGSLQNLGGFTTTSNGVFQMAGFAPTVTANLRGIVFVPVENHITVPTTASIRFAISADDGFEASPTTNLAMVNVTSVNDAPTITGTVAGQIVYDRVSIKPFVGVTITELDNDRQQPLRATVTLDSAAKGGLSSLGGFTDLGGGVYSYGSSNGVITASNITAALRGLVFLPTTLSRVTPGAPETTRFTIRIDDFFAPTVVDTNTTVIAFDPLTAKVTASDRTNTAQFGWAVAATRDLALIGAPKDSLNNNSGSAYLFVRSLDGSNTWTQIKKFLPPDGSSGDEFGTSVGISGDTVVIGARRKDLPPATAGAAYIYQRNQGGTDQWGFVKRLVASDGASTDQFGTSVGISGDTIIVGAPQANAPSSDSGAAYVFERNLGGANQWSQAKKLVAADGAGSDLFGSVVAIDTNTIVIGALQANLPSKGNAGAAYVFSRNQGGAEQWGQVKKLVAADSATSDRFGSSVSVQADLIAVGAPLVDASAKVDSGAAYIFQQNLGGADQWGQVKKIISTEPHDADHFGQSVAISAGMVAIGSPLSDGIGVHSGITYLFAQNQGGTTNWGQLDRLVPATITTSDNFGYAAAFSRNTLVVGAYDGMDGTVRYGKAYMFRVKFNNRPQVALPLANQTVTAANLLNYTLPAGAFSDSDIPETLAYSLGGATPAWVNFNPTSGLFTGAPTGLGDYVVSVVATDSDGATATNQFTVRVLALPNGASTVSMSFQTVGTNRVAVLNIIGASSASYKLQRTASLVSPIVWTDVTTGTTDGTGTVTFTDSNPGDQMFYRAVAQ